MIPKRCRRYDDPGHAHALTFSCYRRLPLLSKDRTRRWLIEAIDEARSLARFDLWGVYAGFEVIHVLPERSRSRLEAVHYCNIGMPWRVLRSPPTRGSHR